MKCMHCGADLPEDQLICPTCGREIQIVPDYNPLDDMLTAQLKGGITQTMSLHLCEQEKQDDLCGEYFQRKSVPASGDSTLFRCEAAGLGHDRSLASVDLRGG